MVPLELVRPDIVLVGEASGVGQDILLLHAGGETRAVWRPVMAALKARCTAYDQRGHGESAGSPGDGILAYGADAAAMIGQLRRPIVVGASLGGFALMLALEELEANVEGLVLVDVTPAPDPHATRAYLTPRGNLGSSPLVEDILKRGEAFTNIVSRLRLPILLVAAGARSPLGEHGRARFRALVPHGNVATIAHASHLVARDAPEALANIIGNFAAQIEDRGTVSDYNYRN